MKIVVIDGQGGKMGRQLIERIRAEGIEADITAVGTNSAATATMLKGGADRAATGENAVRVNAMRADVIIGPIGIVIADAMLGEITAAMAAAIGSSPAKKLLLPISQCNTAVVGVAEHSMTALLKSAVEHLREI